MSLYQGIKGHKRQIEIIERALSGNTVPHAYLFTGMKGIGKKMVALNLASALQCTSHGERPCGMCNACVKSRDANHPDIVLLEPDGKFIKIEQIRELQKRLAYKPFEGIATVCIVDGADKMNPAAANSLLKLLEEPPPAAYLILIAENVRQIIPTIISRCQKLKFNTLSNKEISEILLKEQGLSEKDAASIARISEGSPGKALVFYESFPVNERERLLTAVTELGSMDEVFTLAEELTRKDSVDKLMDYLEIIKFYLRDLAFLKSGMGEDNLINIADRDIMEKGKASYSLNSLLCMAEAVSGTESALLMNGNKRLAVENMLIKFHYAKAKLC